MPKQYSHLVFYDGECGLCDKTVQFLLKHDKNEVFAFAPLQGSTAAQFISQLAPELKQVDSLILVENYRSENPAVYVLANGALRISWLLGGLWKVIGWLSFLPAWMFDWAYRLVARNRHRLFPNDQCFVPPMNQRDRFLP